jgi:hypothetical protein
MLMRHGFEDTQSKSANCRLVGFRHYRGSEKDIPLSAADPAFPPHQKHQIPPPHLMHVHRAPHPVSTISPAPRTETCTGDSCRRSSDSLDELLAQHHRRIDTGDPPSYLLKPKVMRYFDVRARARSNCRRCHASCHRVPTTPSITYFPPYSLRSPPSTPTPNSPPLSLWRFCR